MDAINLLFILGLCAILGLVIFQAPLMYFGIMGGICAVGAALFFGVSIAQGKEV